MKPKHHRTLCKGCKHGLEHHPKRGACVYGHDTVTRGCLCPAFGTPASKIPEPKPFAFDIASGVPFSATSEEGRRRVHVGTVKSINPDGSVSVELGDASAHLVHAAELLIGALRGFIDAFNDFRTRGGVASSSPPLEDAVRSRGRARGKEVDDAAPPVTAPEKLPTPAPVSTPTPAFPSTTIVGRIPDEGVPLDGGTYGKLSKGALVVLRVIAGAKNGCTNARIAVMTGYKPTSRKTYVAELRRSGYISTDGDRHFTASGSRSCPEAALGVYEPPTAKELLDALPEGERAMFDAIAGAGEKGVSDQFLAVVTSYKPTSRKTYLSKLVAREIVEVVDGRRRLTADGRELVGDAIAAKTGAELLEHYFLELPEGESLVLQALHERRRPLSTADICTATNYKPTSVKTYVARLRARELVVSGDQGYELAPELRT
jgi:Mn-dependent DtxR family transcriptional regulator